MIKIKKNKKIVVEIFYIGGNFSAHAPEMLRCVSTGNIPQQIRENIKETIHFHVEESTADGDCIPDKFKEDFELIYKFDAFSLLVYYKGTFTNSALQRLTGIHQKQIVHYASKHRNPRPVQTEKLKNGLHRLGRELLSIDL